MSQEATIGNPIPVGVISRSDDDRQLALPAPDAMPDAMWPFLEAIDVFWLAPLKIGLATSLAATAGAFNPFYAFNFSDFGKSVE